jgi:hypothetical protein
VSRWFPEGGLAAVARGQLRVRLAPDAVELVRLSPGLRPGILQAVRRAVAGGGSAAAGQPWRGALEAVAEALRIEPRLGGAPALVAVSDHWVRWLLVPFSASLTLDAELQSYARMEFEAVHGERARGWTVCLSAPRPGGATPACALDASLPEALREVLHGAAAQLVSLSPGFALAFHRHRKRIGPGPAALALVEPGRCTLGVFQEGAWQAIASPRLPGDPAAALAAELVAVLARGAVASPGTLHVAFASGRRALPAEVAGWKVEVLTEPAVPFTALPADGDGGAIPGPVPS